MIRGGDGHGIDAVALEHLTQVFVLDGFALLELECLLRGTFDNRLVDVDDGGDFGALVARKRADVGFPAPANSDAGDLDALVCSQDLGVGSGGHRGRGGSRGLQEVAAAVWRGRERMYQGAAGSFSWR